MSNRWLFQLDAVTHAYGGRVALRIDRLEVSAGEVLSVVGPTGAGKSTLLRLLAALEPPLTGELRFDSHRLECRDDLPLEVQRRITLVFQRPLLLVGTVRSNVEYGLRLRGLDHVSRVQAILDRLGLSPLASRSARTLSGGETQMVALARALVLEPEVLLLDEPTAHLDPARVALVEEVVGESCRRRGTTVVWATHQLFQARRVAQRVAFLLDGRLVEATPTESFFTTPCDPRSAAFVRGEMVY